MNKKPEQSIKSLNFKWHVMLITADAILLCLFVAPEIILATEMSRLATYRLLSASLLPIFVLLLVNTFSSNMKAMLVYWKPLGVLPGSRAFTHHGPLDPRVDMAQLKKNVGALPTEPKEQNSKWYKLYKQVESRTEVVGAQKDFLLYRDMAAMSLSLLLLGPVGMWIAGVSLSAIGITGAIFLVQYLVTAISSKHAGERFVCNVLAIHSTAKITTTKAPRPDAPTA